MSDALVRELNKMGYQPVFLPRTGLTPPELYNADKGRLIRRGPLADKLPSAANLRLSKGRLADIEHIETSSKSLEGASSFLAKALRCLGVPEAARIDLSFTGSTKLAFTFSGVNYVEVDPTKLEGILQDLDTEAIPVEYLESGKLHIVYHYAYAKALSMARSDGRAFDAEMKGKLGEFIDLGSAVKTEIKKNAVVSFASTGTARAAFAYKAGQLIRLERGWAFKPEIVRLSTADAGIGVALPSTKDSRPFLVARGVVLQVEDRP